MEPAQLLSSFFSVIYGEDEGWACLSSKNMLSGEWQQMFFKYPNELHTMVETSLSLAGELDLYFCPHLLTAKRINKTTAKSPKTVWADLDECDPDLIKVAPSITVETSEGRWQAYWLLEEHTDIHTVEQINKDLVYHHRDDGADVSGWMATKRLRVPLTYNYKYHMATEVRIRRSKPNDRYTPADFQYLPKSDSVLGADRDEFPEKLPKLSAADVLTKYAESLNSTIYELFEEEPFKDSWSERLWALELSLFEVGMSKVEAFIVCSAAACNKYKRDKRPQKALWDEVIRAYRQTSALVKQEQSEDHIPPSPNEWEASPLLTDMERRLAAERDDFVARYIKWATSLGDAAPQYHQAGAFIILSAVLSGVVAIPTQIGTIIPNLWFMILADTTLTRKSTSMDIAMGLLNEVSPDAVMATDGSIEGMLESMRSRAGMPSVFLRDEFTGLMESVARRDYYAGMLETLTKLYDGKQMKRVLKKETVEVNDPILLIYAGGIKTKMVELLKTEHVTSGFIPRFIFITAEADISKLSPLGPPTQTGLLERQKLVKELEAMDAHFWRNNKLKQRKIGNMTVGKTFPAHLTPDAWVRFNEILSVMVADGHQSVKAPILTPTFDRLTISGLKAAALLAACDAVGSEEESVQVDVEHICRAFYFIEKWREHIMYVIDNIDMTLEERTLQDVLNYIKRYPNIRRQEVMLAFRMDVRQADNTFKTLEQRGLIRVKKGKDYTFRATKKGTK